MKTKFQVAGAVVAGLATCQMANATLSFTSGVGDSAVAGVNYVTFDGLPVTGGTESGVTVSFTPDGGVVGPGSGSGYAAPFLSGNNNQYFGGNYTGIDSTKFVTSGGQAGNSAVFTLASAGNYFGLLWGSVDTYNTLSFYDGATLVGTLTGSDVIANPNGSQGLDGTTYVNIFSTVAFDSVVATSGAYAFEIDNVATGVVPEPATYGALAGAGLLLVAVRSQLRKKHV
jgi:hypothetical protein